MSNHPYPKPVIKSRNRPTSNTKHLKYAKSTVRIRIPRTWCDTPFTSMKMLLNTAIRRFTSNMLAMRRYTLMTTGGTQWPTRHSSWPGRPQGGAISAANTSPYSMKYGWKNTCKVLVDGVLT